MNINDFIKQKRVELGYTQDQVAQYLGVSAPAVNKWEKGVSYPDITLLSPLARLLKTDLNTLLRFNEQLTDQEIVVFLNATAEISQKESFKAAFDQAMEKISQYPTSFKFIQNLAAILEGFLLMANIKQEEADSYKEQIYKLYFRCAQSDDPAVAQEATYMLASKYINEDEFEKAQEMLDLLPEIQVQDKKQLQASFHLKKNEPEKAAVILEGKLLSGINEVQANLWSLIDVAGKEGDADRATEIAAIASKAAEIFCLWSYSQELPIFMAATNNKNKPQALNALEKLIKAIYTLWQPSKSPLYCHLPVKTGEGNMGQFMLPALITELETAPQYDFLKGEEYDKIINPYKNICE